MGTPAGWYPSPDGTPVERFWDGNQWTANQRPLPTAGYGPQLVSAPQPDLGRIERGSNRWILGFAMLIGSLVVAFSSFAVWAQLSYAASDGQGGKFKISADLSGFGSVSVFAQGLDDPGKARFAEEQEAAALEDEHPKVPGVAVLTVGVIMALASAAYLKTRQRFPSAVVVTVLGLLILVNCLWRLANVRGMFNDPPAWSQANFSPGFGLVVATVAAFVVAGLGAAAIVMERRGPVPSRGGSQQSP